MAGFGADTAGFGADTAGFGADTAGFDADAVDFGADAADFGAGFDANFGAGFSFSVGRLFILYFPIIRSRAVRTDDDGAAVDDGTQYIDKSKRKVVKARSRRPTRRMKDDAKPV